jgi:imidazolonepropionase-like amidohydrolase
MQIVPMHAAKVGLWLLLAGAAAQARPGPQEPEKEGESAAAEEGAEEDAGEGEEEGEDGEERWFACVGGDVHTGTGAVLREATVLARNGKIREVGQGVVVPEGATVLDATGLDVYPGLVHAATSGLIGGASSEFADSVDPFNPRMLLALAAGVTTAAQSDTAVKLKRGEIEGVVLREKYLSSQSYTLRNPSGRRTLVEKLEAAARYRRKYLEYEEKKKEDKELKEPSKKGVDAGVLDILNGVTLAKFRASEREDLLEIARLAQRFGFRPVIEGCTEGWTVADELGRPGAFAVLTARERRDKSETLVRPGGSSIENAAILHQSGVQVALVTVESGVNLGGIVGRDVLHLPIEAGFAVRGGLSEEAALAAITIVPARILGIDHRVGTLEVGKDCDLLVTDGDLLHYETFVQYAVVEGQQVYAKAEELYFAHIRPRPMAEVAPAERVDPGEEPDEQATSADADAEDADEDRERDE